MNRAALEALIRREVTAAALAAQHGLGPAATARMNTAVCTVLTAIDAQLAEPSPQPEPKPGPKPRRRLRPCGTLAAYRRHKRRSELVDPACQYANRIGRDLAPQLTAVLLRGGTLRKDTAA